MEIEEWLVVGIKVYQVGDVEIVLVVYKVVFVDNFDYLDGLYFFGFLVFKKDNLDLVIVFIEYLLDINLLNVVVYNNFVNFYKLLGYQEQVLVNYIKVVDVDLIYEEVWCNLFLLVGDLVESDDVFLVLLVIIKWFLDNVVVWCSYGYVFRWVGQLGLVVEVFEISFWFGIELLLVVVCCVWFLLMFGYDVSLIVYLECLVEMYLDDVDVKFILVVVCGDQLDFVLEDYIKVYFDNFVEMFDEVL